jgi:hypothetical protein
MEKHGVMILTGKNSDSSTMSLCQLHQQNLGSNGKHANNYTTEASTLILNNTTGFTVFIAQVQVETISQLQSLPERQVTALQVSRNATALYLLVTKLGKM